MICDYFIIRRTRIKTDDLYDAKGPFAGINWMAMIALLVAIAPNLPGFINAATNTAGTDNAIFPGYFDSLYSYAWFVGLGIAAVLYWVLMLGRVKPRIES